MRITLDIQIRSKLPALAGGIEKALAQAVRKTAFDVEAQAKMRAPVDTGALRASIHTVTDRGSTYGGAVSGAKARRADVLLFGEVRPNAALTALVAVGAEYGIYVEMGTRFTAARPYLRPAIEAARDGFAAAAAAAVRGLL